MKIVIDGFGGDNAPDEVLKGAALAVKELGIDIAITGDEKILMERMKALDISDSHLVYAHRNLRSVSYENSSLRCKIHKSF